MTTVRATVQVRRSPSDVFAFLSNVENELAWREGLKAVSLKAGTHATPGAVYAQKVCQMGFDLETETALTAVTADREIDFTFSGGPFNLTGSYQIRPEGNGCTITSILDLGTGVMVKALRGVLSSQVTQDLDRLKQVMESQL